MFCCESCDYSLGGLIAIGLSNAKMDCEAIDDFYDDVAMKVFNLIKMQDGSENNIQMLVVYYHMVI